LCQCCPELPPTFVLQVGCSRITKGPESFCAIKPIDQNRKTAANPDAKTSATVPSNGTTPPMTSTCRQSLARSANLPTKILLSNTMSVGTVLANLIFVAVNLSEANQIPHGH
jgi:hypothetical protein